MFSSPIRWGKKAAEATKNILKKYEVAYTCQEFSTQVPQTKLASLVADGKEIPCQGAGFLSGKISGKEHLLSSLIPSRYCLNVDNINFNPLCKGSISCANNYFAPALAISADDLPLLIRSEKVEGELLVDRIETISENILVGNSHDPKIILFAHYDSINLGATDNASGVAVLMSLIVDNAATLKDVLYVFAGNEELSYDNPTYWGHGYRAFEDKYIDLLNKAKEILVVDCVGNGKTIIYDDENSKYLAFPIKNIKSLSGKTKIISASFKKLMRIYHSDGDSIEELNQKNFEEARELLMNQIKNAIGS